MTQHGEFTIERDLPHGRSAVFQAYADPALRARWASVPDPTHVGGHTLDFREGGEEVSTGGLDVGHGFEPIEVRSHIIDVDPGERIVMVTSVTVTGIRRTVSLITLTFADAPTGTHLTHHEQVTVVGPGDSDTVFLERRGGVRMQLNGIAKAL